MGAGGCDARLYFVAPSDGGDCVGNEFCRQVGAVRVYADPIGVQGGDFAAYSKAVDRYGFRPWVAGEFGGEVAGEVSAVGGSPVMLMQPSSSQFSSQTWSSSSEPMVTTSG